MEKSKSKKILIAIFALIMLVGGAFLLFGCDWKQEPNNNIITPDINDSEVVQYLKEQLSETQKQLTDANILLQSYLKQLEESNKNNATLTEQNQALSSTIQSLQETVSSLNAEVQRLTALLEEYGKIADGTWEVHFYDGEEMIKLLLIRNNTKITETVTAEKYGYKFLGWATEPGGQVANYQDILITQATNFYAVFEKEHGLFSEETGELIKTWDQLMAGGFVTVSDNILQTTNKGLTGKLTIPDGIVKIGDSAFKDSQLSEIVFPESLVEIDKNAVYNCQNLTKVLIPKKVSTIGLWNFAYCPNVAEVSVDGENTTFRSGTKTIIKNKTVVAGWSGYLLVDVSEIGVAAFAGNIQGQGIVKIPENIKAIGSYAFRDCNMSSAEIMNCNVIDSGAFHSCKNLRIAFIGKATQSVSPLGSIFNDNIFYGAKSSLAIYCEDSSRPEGWQNTWNRKDDSSNFTTKWGVSYEAYKKIFTESLT